MIRFALRRVAATTTLAFFSAGSASYFCSCVPHKDAPLKIGYCTDVEGDYAFWQRYLDISRIFTRGKDGEIHMVDGSHFVFGGDAVDWGDGDIRFLNDILDLNDRYPGRVHFLMGNRDINKLRLLQELTPRCNPIEDLRHPYWTQDSAKERPIEQLRKLLGKTRVEDTLANKLKWILTFTMGAPKAFEFRRAELGGKDVSDNAVVGSFRSMIAPGGEMRRYLERAKVPFTLRSIMYL